MLVGQLIAEKINYNFFLKVTGHKKKLACLDGSQFFFCSTERAMNFFKSL